MDASKQDEFVFLNKKNFVQKIKNYYKVLMDKNTVL